MDETGLAAYGFESVLRKVMFLAFEAGKHTLEGRGVVDVTTSVQLGDLILIDRTPPGSGKWKVIELKGGVVNEVLSGLLEDSKNQPNPVAVETQAAPHRTTT